MTAHITPASLELALALQFASERDPIHVSTQDAVLASVPNLREHFAAKAKRAKVQRQLGYLMAKPLGKLGERRLLVVMTREAPKLLDSDNLASAGKNLRDGVADALGVDDRSPQVIWHCQQEKSKTPRVTLRVWRLR